MEREGAIGRTPDQDPNPYAQIPGLVDISILGRPREARSAQKSLLAIIGKSEDFDSALIACARILEIAVRPKNNGHTQTDVIRHSMALLTTILNPFFITTDQNRKPITLMVNQQTLSAVNLSDIPLSQLRKENYFLSKKAFLLLMEIWSIWRQKYKNHIRVYALLSMSMTALKENRQ